jgi:Protein of unknown function (DUF3040)
VLSQDESRQFRRLERGLRATDPAWLERHQPWHRRYADLARLVAVVLASALLWTGATTGVMPFVFCGVLVATAAATSFISSRTTTAPGSADADPGRHSCVTEMSGSLPV